MDHIDYDAWGKVFLDRTDSLCRGEEKRLTQGQVDEINRLLKTMLEARKNLEGILDSVRGGF